MPDELGDELRGLFAQEDARTGGAPDHVLAAVLAGAGRRRRSRTFVTVAASTVGALAIGGASWAVTSSAMQADPVDQPKPVITVTASPTPDGTVPDETDPYESDLDGILTDEYPEVAPTRTDPNPEFDDDYFNVDYPSALVMEDWIWDRVGAGWSLEVVSAPFNPWSEEWVQPPAVMYLVSPEEVRFEIAELPDEIASDAKIVSWDEDDEFVRIAYSGGGGARYDYRTGAWEELQFAVYGEPSESVRFILADAEGDELWRATSSAGSKLYRWDAAASEWEASALVPLGDDFEILDDGPWDFGAVASWDGDRAVLAAQDADGATTGRIVTYTLSSDTFEDTVVQRLVDGYETARPAYAEATNWNWTMLTAQWLDSTSVLISMGDESFTLDTDTGETHDSEDQPESTEASSASRVGWGLATGPIGYECGC